MTSKTTDTPDVDERTEAELREAIANGDGSISADDLRAAVTARSSPRCAPRPTGARPTPISPPNAPPPSRLSVPTSSTSPRPTTPRSPSSALPSRTRCAPTARRSTRTTPPCRR